MDAQAILAMSQAELGELVQGAGQPVKKVVYEHARWVPTHVGPLGLEGGHYSLGQGSVISQGALGPDISNVTATIILEEVLGLVGPEYALRNGCRVVGMPKLVGTIRTATKAGAQSDVKAGEEADYKRLTYGKKDYDLSDYKDVYHVAIIDEDVKKGNTDLFGDAAIDAAIGLAAAEETKIMTLIEATVATSAGGDWASANPYEDIIKASKAIEAATGYLADVVMADELVWADFFGSANVKSAVAAGGQFVYPGGRVFPLPGLPSYIGIKSNAMTDTIAVVANRRSAFGLGDGPTESEQYRIHGAGADVYLLRHWNRSQALLAGSAYKLTAVHA